MLQIMSCMYHWLEKCSQKFNSEGTCKFLSGHCDIPSHKRGSKYDVLISVNVLSCVSSGNCL